MCYLSRHLCYHKNKPRVSPCVILNPILMIIRIATFVLHHVMCPYPSVIHYAMPFPLCYMLCRIHKEISPVMLISLLSIAHYAPYHLEILHCVTFASFSVTHCIMLHKEFLPVMPFSPSGYYPLCSSPSLLYYSLHHPYS